MELLWYILLFNGDWQIGTSDGIYEMNWYADELRVEKASANFSGSLAYYSPNLIRIGCFESTRLGQHYTFDGSIDEVIVENRAWTAEQVKKYHTYSKGRFGII